jgi:hypothetical protein
MSQPEVVIFLIAIAMIFWIVWRYSTNGRGKNENDTPDS